MRAPIGFRISSKRRTLGISQAALARSAGISASYLNLIERNKRHVGGSLLIRLSEALGLDVGELSGEAEFRLIAEVEEAMADPALAGLAAPGGHELVAAHPGAAQAITRLHRAYLGAQFNADAYADRLRSDPLLAQLLHRILSGITAIRSSAEILEDTADLDDDERQRFIGAISRETRGLTDVVRGLVGQFEIDSRSRRLSPARELDDLIFRNNNYFPTLENLATDLRREIESQGGFGVQTLSAALAERFHVDIVHTPERKRDAVGFPGQYQFDASARIMWFQSGTAAATVQFQLVRLYAELAAGDVIAREATSPDLSSDASHRLAHRALSSYLAGAIVFPYSAFLDAAEAARYDVELLRQTFGASFEQVAHRLVTLRRSSEEGIPFGFLRTDPAGRLTKRFPLPGLPLPSSGHACPLWAIYEAFRMPDALARQIVQFADGSRYLFVAHTQPRRPTRYGERAVPTSVMLACDAVHADRTVYGIGYDLADMRSDVPVGPSCRLCTRSDCPDRQEETIAVGGQPVAIRAPLVPRRLHSDEVR